MTLKEKLEQIAYDEGLSVVKANLKSCDGLLCNKVILCDRSLNNRQACAILAEELGHYYMGGGNSAQSTDTEAIRRCEYRAMKKALELTLEKEKIYSLLRQGYYVYEIAEMVGVSDCFLQTALEVWGRFNG